MPGAEIQVWAISENVLILCLVDNNLLDDAALLEGLRRGDEDAFMALVARYHASLVRLAQLYVRDPAVAEDVAQETWLGVLQGVGRFEGRAALKTWLFTILTNRAKTRAQREGRSVPFSALLTAETEGDEPAVAPERFWGSDHPRWPGHWAEALRAWDDLPEESLEARETLAQVQAAIDTLPPAQRAVIQLRDVEGWGAEEVCNVLNVTETNQRVLLHRARAKVRQALERYLG